MKKISKELNNGVKKIFKECFSGCILSGNVKNWHLDIGEESVLGKYDGKVIANNKINYRYIICDKNAYGDLDNSFNDRVDVAKYKLEKLFKDNGYNVNGVILNMRYYGDLSRINYSSFYVQLWVEINN